MKNKIEGVSIIDTPSIACKCRKRDSNPHGRNAQGILSPSCLPFHHSGILFINVSKNFHNTNITKIFEISKLFSLFLYFLFTIYSNVTLYHHTFYYNTDLNVKINFFFHIRTLYHKQDKSTSTFLFSYDLFVDYIFLK